MKKTTATTLLALSLAFGLSACANTWHGAKEDGHEAKEATERGWDKTKDATEHGWDKTKDATEHGWDKTKEATERGWDKTKNAVK